jgi:hypothetical protein
MNAREVLAELDRLGVAAWWQQISAAQDQGTTIQTSRPVPPELRAAIDENTETLLKIMERRPGRSPGIYHRPPRERPEGEP